MSEPKVIRFRAKDRSYLHKMTKREKRDMFAVGTASTGFSIAIRLSVGVGDYANCLIPITGKIYKTRVAACKKAELLFGRDCKIMVNTPLPDPLF